MKKSNKKEIKDICRMISDLEKQIEMNDDQPKMKSMLKEEIEKLKELIKEFSKGK